MNTSQTAPSQAGNRITFTSQQLQNGTISVSNSGPTIISTTQLPNTTTIKTITSNAGLTQHHPGLQQQHHQQQQQQQQVQIQHQQLLQTATASNTTAIQQQQQQTGSTNVQQHAQAQGQPQGQTQTPTVGATQTQTLVIKSNHHAVTLPAGLVSSAPGIVTMTKTINQGNQQLLNTMLPGGVVVGMRPPTAQQQQKNMQNQLGRVVISNSHMVGARPQSPSITLSTLNPGQTPALLLKTDNGFQLLRVGTAATSTVGPTMTQTIGSNSTNPTQIRLQTVPASVSRFTGQPATSATSTTTTSNIVTAAQNQQQQAQQQHHHQSLTLQQQAPTTIKTTSHNAPLVALPPPQPPPSIALRKTIVRTTTTSSAAASASSVTSNNNNNNNNLSSSANANNTVNKIHINSTAQQHLQQQQHQAATTATLGLTTIATVKQIKQNTMANTSTSNNIIVNSVSTSNSTPHVYNSSTQPPHLQPTTQHQLQTPHLAQITQIQTLTAQSQHQTTNASTLNSINSNNSNAVVTTTTTATSGAAAATQQHQQATVAMATTPTTTAGNTKEKCRKFLANLIDLSTREPKPVEKNVRSLIQELVNANVEPEEFCDRLERLLNASPQPCLIGFLKKSLPLLRHALYAKELVIEGIKPPPQHVLGLSTLHQQLPKIQAQIRPISQPNQTTTIGQTQVRMISHTGVPLQRPPVNTTITKQPSFRIQAPPNGPRLVNAQIRGPLPTGPTQQSTPQLPTHTNIVQIRGPTTPAHFQRPAVQFRTTKGPAGGLTPTSKVTAVKVGQTQIKPVLSSQPPSLAAISNSIPPTPTLSATAPLLTSLSSTGGSGLPVPSLPTVQLPPEAMRARETMHTNALNNLNNVILNNNNNHAALALGEIKLETKMTELKHEYKLATLAPLTNKLTTMKTNVNMSNKAASKKKKDPMDKDKDDKLNSANSASSAAAASSFFQQNSMSMSSSMYGDDDINDVAAMGGVNLAEESQRILGCTENIGTQIRSCKDEVFLNLPALQTRIRGMMLERGLEEPSQDVAVLISHAVQERLKSIVEELAVIAEHRIDVIKLDPRYEVSKDVRGQIKFLEELDKAEHKRHEELEREMLLRAAKSRSRIEDSEQAKLKARAKEMQRAEMEELRQRDANLTALQAIGPRKKIKLDNDGAAIGMNSGGGNSLSGTSTTTTALRPRIKRINLRDMLFYMEQDRNTCRSQMLYKAYLK